MKSLNLIALMSLVSCGFGGKMTPLDYSVKVDEQIRAEEVNFAALQKEVLPKCIGCHSKWITEDAFSKFIKPGDPEGSQFFDSVKTGRMPKNSPPLSSAKLEIVRNYILNMKVADPVPEPAPVPGPLPEPTPETKVTFQDLHAKVFSVSCLPCHSATLNDESKLIEKWVDKSSPELSKLLVETETGRMPKIKPPLTTEQLQLIRDYVNQFR